jgi:hypothetical protein
MPSPSLSSFRSAARGALRRRHIQLLPAALLALAACGTTTRFAPLNQPPHHLQPRAPESVQVFTTATPARPYIEVGLIQGTQESEYSFDDMPEIIAAMRVKAGELGCDGLVLNGPSSKGTESSLGIVSGAHHERTLEGFWGTCIAYTDRDPADPPPFGGAVVALPPPGPASSEPVIVAPPPPPRVAQPAPIIVPPPPPRVDPAPAYVAPPPPPRVEPAPAPAPAPVVAPPPPPRAATP